ncbi:MAG: SUMF1/EgtB/PvdO family nonheme iron enzyme [Verrucomicrobiota bacterium]
MKKFAHFFFWMILSFALQAETPSQFENSLEQKFVKIPETSTFICVWKTRVSDYKKFVAKTGRKWPSPEFKQTANDPAVNISWEDAKAFCYWLNEEEHASGKLPADWNYRLPTDKEWSQAAGLKPVDELTEFSGDDATAYPWGKNWPPPPNCGNYSPHLQVDKFPYTSPVGTFPPNKLGLYDLGGNAWEWCEDIYNRSADYRVLRGGSWRVRQPMDLLLSNRVGNQPDLQLSVYGFRLVIETPKPPEPVVVPQTNAVPHQFIPKK